MVIQPQTIYEWTRRRTKECVVTRSSIKLARKSKSKLIPNTCFSYIEQLFWRQDGIIDYPQLYLKSQTQNQSFDKELSPVMQAPKMVKMTS